MSNSLSRRAILAGAASASVVALPVVAAAAVPASDQRGAHGTRGYIGARALR